MTTILRSRPILTLVLALLLVLVLAVAFVLLGLGSSGADMSLAGGSWSGPMSTSYFTPDLPGGFVVNGASWS